ncbi:conserved hypothetical protein [Nocardioides sp. AX2bis]|nr:conserved hypothetical protein [Nocardioides sp. AX2bis]
MARAYAATFAGLCAGAHEPLLDAALVGPGTRVLDVGCGPGGLAAAATARDADVTALDPDPGMVALARSAAPTAAVEEGGLPDLPLDGLPHRAYDAVLAAFVLNHLPDPRTGLAALAGATAPGGRVAVTVWPSGATPQSRLWEQVVAEAGAVPPPGVRLAPELDFPRTVDGLAAVVAGSGLAVLDARLVAWTHVCDPGMVWAGASAGIGGQGATLLAQTPEVQRRMREAYERHVADLVVDGRLHLATTAVLVTAEMTLADSRDDARGASR